MTDRISSRGRRNEGRPCGGDGRTATLRTRVTPEELQEVKDRAKQVGMSTSNYVRKRTLQD